MPLASPLRTRFTNLRVVMPDAVRRLDLIVAEDGRIVDLAEPGRPSPIPDLRVVDGGGAYAFPGMLDVLTHGYGEYLYVDAIPGAIRASARILPRHGVTGFAPSITSKAEPELMPILATLHQDIHDSGVPLAAAGPGARILGIHSEGPCFAAAGAHRPDNLLLPSAGLAERMVAAAGGSLRFTTLAAELPGSSSFLDVMIAAGVSVHLGHSDAPPEGVPGYADQGIRAVTHMYDVFKPAPVIEPGRYPVSLADACLAEPRLCLGVICDGVHVLPIQVKLLAQLPADRVFLETDSMKFTALPPGRFELYEGGWVNTFTDGPARDDNGGLVGSLLTSDAALRNFVAFTGVDLPRASIAASLNPARIAGLDASLGSLVVGKQADFVVLDDALQVQRTYVGGRRVYDAAATGDAAYAPESC